MTKKAATIPTPAEVLQEETMRDEAELNKLREESEKPQAEPEETETEELAEESLPSEDEGESESKDKPDQQTADEDEPESGEQESGLSERGRKRFEQLSQDKRRLLQEVETYKKMLAQREEEYKNLAGLIDTLQGQGYTQSQAEAIAPHVNQQYIDPRRYQQDVARQAQVIVEQTLNQREQQQMRAQAIERFQEDLTAVESKYEVLNEDSPEYDEKLAFLVSDLYKSRSEYDPKIRLTDVVEEVMAVRRQAAEESSKKQVHKLAKKASQQAISPSGGRSETNSLAKQLEEVDSEAELLELRKKLPIDG